MYTSFVSLGSWCITAHHLKRLEIARSKSIFDWTFTFYRPLCKLIESDFEGVFELKNLEFDDGSVLDHGSGLRFMHAFTRDPDNTVSQATIKREYEAARAKVDHLVGRWLHRVQQPGKHLYIWAIMPSWMDGTPSREAVLNIEALIRRKYPSHEFDLLAVSTQAEDVDWQIEHSFLRRAENYTGTNPAWGWIGDVASWDRILGEFRHGPPISSAPYPIGEQDCGLVPALNGSRSLSHRRSWLDRLQAMFGTQSAG